AGALKHLGSYEDFARLFLSVGDPEAVRIYDEQVAPHLDPATRGYWEGRTSLGRRRISGFSRNFYRQGLLGRFITAGHLVARLHGRNPARMVEARSREEQKAIFNEELAPLFDKRHLRWLMERPASLFGLGIPP